jgi:hypothetical protein
MKTKFMPEKFSFTDPSAVTEEFSDTKGNMKK